MIKRPIGFDWQGHRGARGLLPENTIPAFLKAVDYGVTSLELDVAISKDAQIVISHEPWFSHHICSHPDGKAVSEAESHKLFMYGMDYSQIKAFDCGMRGNTRFPQQKAMPAYKPLLEEMVETVEKYCAEKELPLINYSIEIKSKKEGDDLFHPAPSEFVRLVLSQIEKLAIRERCMLQSFDLRVLREIHKQAEGVPVSFLVEGKRASEGLEANIEELGFLPAVYSPNYTFVDKAMVRTAHKKGMKVIPWTVNSIDEMKALIKLGVDGIITDYPDKIF